MKFNELNKKRRPGFTLVEMVVVVTILGILSGLGFMKFDEVQRKAKEYELNKSVLEKIYITTIPEPQSESDEKGFIINISSGSVSSVEVGGKKFYPKS